MIKLVNYVRNEVRWGNKRIDLSSKSFFDDDQYLQPVLEDDALLYSLDDIFEGTDTRELPVRNENSNILPSEDRSVGTVDPVIELEESMQVLELEKTLYRLQNQFKDYREAVTKILDHRWNTEDTTGSANKVAKSSNETLLPQDDDSGYFSSYSTNGPFF